MNPSTIASTLIEADEQMRRLALAAITTKVFATIYFREGQAPRDYKDKYTINAVPFLMRAGFPYLRIMLLSHWKFETEIAPRLTDVFVEAVTENIDDDLHFEIYDRCGYGAPWLIHVDEVRAMRWLQYNRPAVYKRLLAI